MPTQALETLQAETRSYGSLPEVDLGADSILQFVHIPKTAGTSLRRYLDQFFLPQQVFPPEITARYDKRDVALLSQFERSCLNRFRLIRGHHALDALQPFLGNHGKQLHNITVLRDPLQQLVSEYKMSQTDRDYPHHSQLRGISFGQFLESELVDWIRAGNRQTSHLIHQHHLCDALPPEDEQLDRASEALSGYAVVGIHEQLPAVMQVIARTFGWYSPPSVPHFNKARMTDFELTTAERSRAEELTNVDRKLYELAKTRFDAQLRWLLESSRLQSGRGDGRAVTDHVNRTSVARRERRLAASSPKDYVEIINSEGFHLCHLDRHHQRQIQWIGPDPQATITVGFSTPVDYRLRIHVVHWLTDAMLQNFRVMVNGSSVRLEQHRRPCGVEFIGTLPRKLIEREAWNTRITLTTSAVSSPRELGLNASDNEVKSLAISAVELATT